MSNNLELPLWHRHDPETSRKAAADTANGARALRVALCTHLRTKARQGLTGDEASSFVESAFPGRFVEYAGRRRLSDLCDPTFGDNEGPFGKPTRHRRLNRRGNVERVVIHRDYYRQTDQDRSHATGERTPTHTGSPANVYVATAHHGKLERKVQ